jgi:hypothetical protein
VGKICCEIQYWEAASILREELMSRLGGGTGSDLSDHANWDTLRL